MSSPDTAVNSPPADPPQLASPEQLPAMDALAKESASTANAGKGTAPCSKTSWFAIRVIHKPAGSEAEQPVDGLTLSLELSCSGPAKSVTSKNVEKNQIDSLSPGGTCNVVATDHSDVVWEVETDVS